MQDVRYAESGDVRIAYEVREGNREAPWVVLIHGWGYGRWGWQPVVDQLAEQFRVVLFDNRGIGDSDIPAGPYSTAAMADDVVALMDHAGIDRAHVVGTSLGGLIAEQVAIRHPDRVDRLVLVCATPGVEDAYPMPERTQRLVVEASQMDPEARLRRLVENALADRSVSERPELVDELVGHRRRHPPDPAGWQAQGMAGATHSPGQGLREISAPTLIIQGDNDNVVDPRNAEFLAEAIPDTELVRLPDAGHLLFWEEPERFVDEVLRFLGPAHPAPEGRQAHPAPEGRQAHPAPEGGQPRLGPEGRTAQPAGARERAAGQEGR